MTKPVSVADVFASVFGDCVDHQHKQVGPCVYCNDCGRRLYQGKVLTLAELDTVKQVIAERVPDETPNTAREQPRMTFDPDDFDATYQLRMITAYPVIGGLHRDGLMFATPEVKRAAFERILKARNLRRTHELYLDAKPTQQGETSR